MLVEGGADLGGIDDVDGEVRGSVVVSGGKGPVGEVGHRSNGQAGVTEGRNSGEGQTSARGRCGALRSRVHIGATARAGIDRCEKKGQREEQEHGPLTSNDRKIRCKTWW